MGLLYAKNIKHAQSKVNKMNQYNKSEIKNYKVSLSKMKSEEKGYKLYNVKKLR